MTVKTRETAGIEAYKIIRQEKSKTAVFIFSAAGTKTFHHFETFQHFPVNKIFVKDPFLCYYNRGIPGLGTSISEVAFSLKRIVGDLDCRKTIMFGTSMGSYAAILFGCLIQADQVLVMGTRTLLDAKYISFNINIRSLTDLEYPDLSKIVKKYPWTQICSCCGEDNWLDIFHSINIRGYPNVGLYSVKNVSHNTLVFLKEHDILIPFLEGFLESGRARLPEGFLGNIFQDSYRLRYIKKIFPLIVEKKLERAEKLLSKALRLRPEWAGAYYYLGEVLRMKEVYDKAENMQRKAIELNRNFAAAYLSLGKTLDSQARYIEAEEALSEAVGQEPNNYAVNLSLGLVLFHQGKLAQAERSLRMSVELEPGLADAHYHLGRVLFDQNRFEEAEKSYLDSVRINPVFAKNPYRKGRSNGA